MLCYIRVFDEVHHVSTTPSRSMDRSNLRLERIGLVQYLSAYIYSMID